MSKRQIVLEQSTIFKLNPIGTPYKVVQLKNTVMYNVGDYLSKADVENLLRRPNLEVLIK